MRALIQRVAQASVTVEDEVLGSISAGLVVFLGFAQGDADSDAQYIVDKIVNLRIFADQQNRFNRSALDTGAELLIVSQFTLYADTRKGRRPDFNQAASPDEAQRLYEYSLGLFRQTGLKVETGRFQAQMQVQLQNDGPVTLMLDSADRHRPRR
ncbi:MAG: D-aminoacyl-tRNA deacylase [Chloroflexi bacterium]|nr:D-aminoacyl-tRNA deacylase [Chloroflexota bacterium]MDA1219850.1 D-aminoacyl-tRNA deacylase [Chloroflexota bacterium]PKB57168.1 MAG: D-tyrosyl-tRNA(Tyr) deacylase [SAR202 cluster bacterium Casp-Chloro-G3]